MKGLAKRNNKTRGKTTRRKKSRGKATRKRKIHGGDDNDVWVNQLICAKNNLDEVAVTTALKQQQEAGLPDGAGHLRDEGGFNDGLWRDICENREKNKNLAGQTTGGKKRKYHKKRK